MLTSLVGSGVVAVDGGVEVRCFGRLGLRFLFMVVGGWNLFFESGVRGVGLCLAGDGVRGVGLCMAGDGVLDGGVGVVVLDGGVEVRFFGRLSLRFFFRGDGLWQAGDGLVDGGVAVSFWIWLIFRLLRLDDGGKGFVDLGVCLAGLCDGVLLGLADEVGVGGSS